MGLFGRTPAEQAARAERAVAVEQHKAYRDAGNQAAKKLSDSDPLIHDLINEAIIDAEQHVSWWRR